MLIIKKYFLYLLLIFSLSTLIFCDRIFSEPIKEINLTRDPYLQMSTPTDITIRWRTNVKVDSKVSYGLNRRKELNTVKNSDLVLNHKILLSGLKPDTRYYYSIGSSKELLKGGDEFHFFKTLPLPESAKNTRIWVIGDSGTADINAMAVRDSFLTYSGTKLTDVWLMLGDNAYPKGTDVEYQASVFNMYNTLLRNTVVWPTFGNHDGKSASSIHQTGPYYDIFTIPKSKNKDGSNTSAYYSFNYGNVHFISLNSESRSYKFRVKMIEWLKNDLKNVSPKNWIIAFWHHPPYSKGSHNSDRFSDSGGRMFFMREKILPIIESEGVDLVLTGHSHSYERSYLLYGHYRKSNTLSAEMIINSGDGRLNGNGSYLKSKSKEGKYLGTVYVVNGSSGRKNGGSLNHPAMFISHNLHGSLIINIKKNKLTAIFLDKKGIIQDYFSIIKKLLLFK